VERTVHIEGDDLVELFGRGFNAALADRSRAAGDVDQNVDAAVIDGLGLLGRGAALLRIGEIAGDDDGFRSR